MKKLIRWFDINFEACFGMIFFFIMLGIILMQIFLRNILGAGTAWGEEICKFCYLAMHAMTIAAPVMFIISMSSGFGSILSIEQIPAKVAELILAITNNKILLLMIINVVYLIMGTFMETNAAIILTVPILLPIMTAVGVSPIHFGIITIVNLAIGFVTPPLGANLFMASAIGGVPLNKLAKDIWPWIGTAILALLLITYIPELVLFLPRLMGYTV